MASWLRNASAHAWATSCVGISDWIHILFRTQATKSQKMITYPWHRQFLNGFNFSIINDIMIDQYERSEGSLLFFHSGKSEKRTAPVCVPTLQF